MRAAALSERREATPPHHQPEEKSPLEENNPYEQVSRKVVNTPSLKRIQKDLRVLTGEDEEDQLQDVLLLTLQLMKRYPHFTEEEITSKQFSALLRRAYERDLIDRLERRCTTWVWGLFGRERKRITKVAWVEVFDPEEKYDDVNETDGRITLPRLEDPEPKYMVNHILGRMKAVFSDRWAIVGDLLVNEDFGDYVSGITPSYVAAYANFDRIPAKVVCDAHGLGERKRKTFLGKLRDFLVVEGVADQSASAAPAATVSSVPSSVRRIASGACPSSGVAWPCDGAHRAVAGLSVASEAASARTSSISPRQYTGGGRIEPSECQSIEPVN
jgi:hypothetical protein